MLPRLARNYPRSRGEEAVKLGLEVDDWELPPLARGRAFQDARDRLPGGITPARAGKRPMAATPSIKNWNYPRSRGEEVQWPTNQIGRMELPPLARGRGLSYLRFMR